MAGVLAAAMPSLIYGTAWKKDATHALVKQAILSGFRGIDTAAQPKHYQEHLVGQGIRDAMAEGSIDREEIYIQTKYASINGQDPMRVPYNPQASIAEQVKTSVESSLSNLTAPSSIFNEHAYVDCLVLHSPFPLRKQTEEAWRAMEAHAPHPVRTLGISNIYHLPALQALYEFARIKPVVVQNRFYRDTGYDLASVPSAPRRSPAVTAISENANVSAPVALYSLVLGLGKVSVLNGTTNSGRMKDDLEGIRKALMWAQSHGDEWQTVKEAFEGMLEL